MDKYELIVKWGHLIYDRILNPYRFKQYIKNESIHYSTFAKKNHPDHLYKVIQRKFPVPEDRDAVIDVVQGLYWVKKK